jgi:hypothetical protein
MKGTGIGLAVGAFVFLGVVSRVIAMDTKPNRYCGHHSDPLLCNGSANSAQG